MASAAGFTIIYIVIYDDGESKYNKCVFSTRKAAEQYIEQTGLAEWKFTIEHHEVVALE